MSLGACYSARILKESGRAEILLPAKTFPNVNSIARALPEKITCRCAPDGQTNPRCDPKNRVLGPEGTNESQNRDARLLHGGQTKQDSQSQLKDSKA